MLADVISKQQGTMLYPNENQIIFICNLQTLRHFQLQQESRDTISL